MSEQRPSLSGSDRRPVAGARPVGRPDPAATVELTLVLRRRAELPEGPAPR